MTPLNKVPITNLYLDDIVMTLGLTPEQAAQVTQDDLKNIADAMRDDYVNQMFWSSLKILSKEFLDYILNPEDPID